MDIKTLIAILVPSVLTTFVAILNIYLNYKKSKEQPKDEIWETTTKIICKSSRTDALNDVDNFAEVYEQLTYFKNIGYKLPYMSSLDKELRKAKSPENN